jgi:hypothetical protein
VVRKASVAAAVRRKSGSGDKLKEDTPNSVGAVSVVALDTDASSKGEVEAGNVGSSIAHILDPATGSYYFYDTLTGKSAWTKEQLQ